MLSHFPVTSSSPSNVSWKQNPCAAIRLHYSTHVYQTFQVLLFALIWKTHPMPFTDMPTPAITDMENSCILEHSLRCLGNWKHGCGSVTHPERPPAKVLPVWPRHHEWMEGALVAFGQFLQAHIHVRSRWDGQDSWSHTGSLGRFPMQGQAALLCAGHCVHK